MEYLVIRNKEGTRRIHLSEISSLSFTERLLEYMRIQRRYFDKELFIFYGIRAVMTSEERKLFYQQIMYEKLNVLLIENALNDDFEESEAVIIIDNDLCVIY